jgi:hypothetical protein
MFTTRARLLGAHPRGQEGSKLPGGRLAVAAAMSKMRKRVRRSSSSAELYAIVATCPGTAKQSAIERNEIDVCPSGGTQPAGGDDRERIRF